MLVTGAAGFIGAALTRELLARGDEVLALDDLSAGRAERLPDHPRLRRVVADVAAPGVLAGLLAERVDAVVHLAARVGVRAVLLDPDGCYRVNVDGARALADALATLPESERPRLLAASSSEVYSPRGEPLTEAHPLRALDGAGRWRYAASKRAAEEQLDASLASAPGREVVHVRFFNVVGPDQDAGTGMVLPTFVDRALAGRPLPVHGDGSALRTFAHVDEVARVLADLLERPTLPAGPLNVGGRARASVLELAHEVARQAGTGAHPELVDPRLDVAPSFEGVAWREPALERLASLGVTLPSRPLSAIVADVLERRRADLQASPIGAPSWGDACASPAS